MKEKILVLEDEVGIRSFVSINLKREGFEVIEAETGQDAIYKISNEDDIKIALLDVMLPDMSGIEVCKYIREKFENTGIIMLTAKSQEEDKIEGFMNGADDYMTKPFSINELLVRINALLRRVKSEIKAQKGNVIEIEPFVLDLDKRKLFKNDKEIELTPTELSIVRYLMENTKKSLSREEILDKVWGNNILYDFKIVDVNIRRIRNKLEDDASKPKYVQTVWGYGYCFKKDDVK
ncbi:MAG: response regulator transcription factor [Peptostreptococcaceae bacterium]